MLFRSNFAKPWAVLIELGSRCKKCKKYNKLDPKNAPKNFGTFWTLFTPIFFSHFLLLFFRFFFLVIPPYQGGKNRTKKGPKSTKIFWGVFWIQFVIFFAFFTSRTQLNQNGPRFCKIWPNLTLQKFLVTFYCCFFFRSNPRFLKSPKWQF